MRRLLKILLTLLIVSCIAIFTWFNVRFFITPISVPASPPTLLTVNPGTPVTQLVWDLHDKGLLNDPYYFLIMAKLSQKLNVLKAGEYIITPHMTEYDLLKKLGKGERVLRKVTFLEGATLQQILENLKSIASIQHVVGTQGIAEFMATVGRPGENPEGWFYPDTYLFNIGTKDTKLLRMSYDLMQKKLHESWKNRAPNLPYKTPYEALIVASMIEKETAVPAERAQIAGVILKRLEMGMPLQIDAAVIYGLGKEHRGKVTYADLGTETPYNTYLHKGLPPTPIGMPSGAAIEAALHPEIGSALYYVAKGDGTHTFSDTFQAHHLAVADYFRTRDQSHAVFLAALQGRCISPKLQLNYWMLWGNKTLLLCLIQ